MGGSPGLPDDNWRRIAFPSEVRALEPFACPTVSTQSAQESYGKVLAATGATLPHRDKVDRRVCEEVRTRGGRIIVHEDDVGGFPAYAAGEPPADSDADGIPDEWETRHTLNPHDPSDAQAVSGDAGYTNQERYLNQD